VRRILNAIVAVALGLGGARAARAAEVTRVVSGSRQPGALVDVHLSLGWLHESRSARLEREAESQATGGQIALRNDLVYQQTRDVLALRADVGVWRDLSLFLSLPLVLADDRADDFDRSGCGGTAPGCVDETNATILRDGILPGFGAPSYGLDAPHARPFSRPSETVFRGPTRKGLDYLGLGMTYALLNQDRDFAQPTWLVRFEARLAVGGDMRFDPLLPGSNTAAGPGAHQLVFSTIFSRRRWALEPYLGGWYVLALPTAGGPLQESVLGKGAGMSPQQRTGSDFGVEAVVWDDPRSQRRITLELAGHLELRLAGLSQGELWEPLSGSAACARDGASCRRDVDRDLNGNGTPDPNPGTTRTPAYGILGGDAGIGVRAGRFVRFRALFGLAFEQAHFLTDARSGNEVYDLPGRRFRVEDGRSWHLAVEGGLLF
jgi:hypothetical protein